MDYPDKLYITRHNADGTIEVEHRRGLLVCGSYTGYARKDAYKLYQRKYVLQRELKYAGKVVGVREIVLDLPPVPQTKKQSTNKNKEEKTTQIKSCEQISMF